MKKVFGTILVTVVAFISAYAVLGQKSSDSPKSNQDYLIKIETSMGDMYAVLYETTPKHRTNFIKLIKGQFYDDLLFHRVIPEFMIQGGDPESKGASKSKNLGTGGPGYTIPAEIGKGHFKGTLAAARIGGPSNPEKRSSGSQFYITQGKTYDSLTIASLYNQKKQSQINILFREYISQPENADFVSEMRVLQQSGNQEKLDSLYTTIQPFLDQKYKEQGAVVYTEEDLEKYQEIGGVPFLDGDYTVFGEVVKGLDIIDKIAVVKTNNADRPTKDVIMKISYEILTKKEITKRTGYKYK